MKLPVQIKCRAFALSFAAVLVPQAAYATTSLADGPLAASSVPGNVLLTLSVEYPTAIDVAHFYSYNVGTTTNTNPTSPAATTAPTGAVPFLGYYDPGKCYTYISATADTTNGPYFQPTTTATDSNYNCSSVLTVNYTASYSNNKLSAVGTPTIDNTKSTLLWSGNFLNWATMQTIDPFRSALTGGYRAVDSSSVTILEKAYASNQGGYSDFPDRTLTGAWTITAGTSTSSQSSGNSGSFTRPSSTGTVATVFEVTGPTPYPTSGQSLRVYNLGNKMYFTASNGSGVVDTGTAVVLDPGVSTSTSAPYAGDKLPSVSSNSLSTTYNNTIYAIQSRVKVCDSSLGTAYLEDNCKKYGSNYKPEGLMQQYNQKMRFGTFGYLNDSSAKRDGGVLRAKMAYIGPQQPVPGGTPITNSNPEWDGSTGIIASNPIPNDATATNNYYGFAAGTIAASGNINYINSFGEAAKTYKGYDPVSELYYAGIRYFENLGNVPEYTVGNNSNYGSAVDSTHTSPADGFPVITNWDDPIKYYCQKNFILGIGDVNTHLDNNLPNNAAFRSAHPTSNEPTLESAVSNDSTSANVGNATAQVGTLEGISNLNTKLGPQGDYNGYGIAGLAYDAHVRDLRSDLTGSQTVSTFWVDVQEYQQYIYQNQFWLAAKYGGFTVPSGWSEYSSTAGQIATSAWSHSNTDAGFPGVTTANPLPDNYFSGGRPDNLENGLKSAFAKIASSIDTTTAFSVISSKLNSSNNVSYSASYDPGSWSGDVQGKSLSFDSSGNPTINFLWSAQATLDAAVAASNGTGWNTGRRIVTLNSGGQASSSTNPAVAFRSTSNNISSTNLSNLASTAGGTDGTAVANYLRGDQSNEGISVTNYRQRSHILGDVVNSHVIAVGAPGIAGTPEAAFTNANNPNYSSFASAHSSRGTVVYVGANDGMVHAFSGGTSGGQELFAYVPSALYAGPSSPATPTVDGLAHRVAQNFSHHYLVDATPTSGDVDFGNTPHQSNADTASATSWHTLLVGGLGKGGKGYYALDVTSADTVSTEAGAAATVLWELTTTQASHLGFSYGTPVLVKTKYYGWVVMVTSGYNNDDGYGHLFLINPKTGAVLQDIATPSVADGLGPATAFVADLTDNTADAVYAGDLNGNLWRFDVSDPSGSFPAPVTLFSATNSSSTAQPITSAPLVEIDPITKKRYVLFGTGKLLASGDIASSDVQSFYAVIDGNAAKFGGTTGITRSSLTQDTNTVNGIGTVSPSNLGWYIDLPVSMSGSSSSGGSSGSGSSSIASRVVSTGNENFGVVAFAANLPNGDTCNPSGSNVVYAVSLSQGASLITDSNGSIIANFSDVGSNTALQFVNVAGAIRLLTGNDQGGVSNVPGKFNNLARPKYLNWREVDTTH